MTSTPFNVGLGDGSRLSSRVLRPPGGGHTDIFGGEAEPQRGRRPAPSVLAAAAAAAASAGQGDEAKPTNGSVTPNQNGQETPQERTPEPAPEPKVASPAKIESPTLVECAMPEPSRAEPPKRVRVPPGGFSSGLW